MNPGGVTGTHGQDLTVGDTVGIGVGTPVGQFICTQLPPVDVATCPVGAAANRLHVPTVDPAADGIQFNALQFKGAGIDSDIAVQADSDDDATVCVNRTPAV